jgi:hypothetical protein
MDVVLPSSTEQRVVVIDIIQMRFVCYTPEEEEKKNGHATVPVKTLCCTLSSIYLLDVYLLYYINNIRVGKKF